MMMLNQLINIQKLVKVSLKFSKQNLKNLNLTDESKNDVIDVIKLGMGVNITVV
jgi:hypothetical protein